MAAVTSTFVRLTPRNVAVGGGETRLISPGVVNTDFIGSLTFAANTLTKGAVIRINAWGTWNNPADTGGNLEVRLYLNPGGALASPNADTGVIPLIGATPPGQFEWLFSAQITILAVGATGSAFCDSFLDMAVPGLLGNFPLTPVSSRVYAGLGSNPIDTTVANALELTAELTQNGSLTLNQCSVETL